MDRTGNPVLVAVVDTGVDWQHPDLAANLWQHSQGFGIDITTLGGTVSYFPSDISAIGHGTHVSGMIAAASDNGIGITGVMPFRAKVMPIKLFAADASGNLSTTSQYFYNALRFAYLNGASVANLSIGSITFGTATDPVAEQAVSEALGKGLTIVTVTGNSEGGANGQEVNGSSLTVIPGIYSNRQGVIGVGSIDAATGTKSFFSHYSTTYGEVAAAGAEQGSTGVLSTLPRTLSSYGRLAGTSQAAPQVSAAAALTIGILKDAYGTAPTPAEVERLIVESAYKDPRLTNYFKGGNRLDLVRLVQKINTDYPNTRAGGTTVFPGTGVSGLGTGACN
jgi:subtilisin family serine protease